MTWLKRRRTGWWRFPPRIFDALRGSELRQKRPPQHRESLRLGRKQRKLLTRIRPLALLFVFCPATKAGETAASKHWFIMSFLPVCPTRGRAWQCFGLDQKQQCLERRLFLFGDEVYVCRSPRHGSKYPFPIPNPSTIVVWTTPYSLFAMNLDCTICEQGYGRTMAFECGKCSSGEGIAVGVIVVVAAVVAWAALVVYMISDEQDGGRVSFITRVKEKVSFQSLKIVIVVGQILTQVRSQKCSRWSLFLERKPCKRVGRPLTYAARPCG